MTFSRKYPIILCNSLPKMKVYNIVLSYISICQKNVCSRFIKHILLSSCQKINLCKASSHKNVCEVCISASEMSEHTEKCFLNLVNTNQSRTVMTLSRQIQLAPIGIPIGAKSILIGDNISIGEYIKLNSIKSLESSYKLQHP